MGDKGRDVGKDAKTTPDRIKSASNAVDNLDPIEEAITGRHRAVDNLNDGILLKIASDGLNKDATGHARRTIDDKS